MAILVRLWLPILLSAVLVFLASSIIHMALKWHNAEYRKLPDEDLLRDAFQKADPAPGQYVIPWCLDPKERESEAAQRKYKEGPVALVWLMPKGLPNMGKSLGLWFAFNLVIGVLVAYLAGHVVPPGHRYLEVFRVVGTTAFMAHGLGQVSGSIWMGKPWSATAKDLLDAMIYALLTAGTFGWLWPK
jgi:hypothetical protein